MSFLNISQKEQYGLRLALRLAKTYKSRQPLSVADIAKKENISRKYLEELAVPLKKAGFIKSRRGRNGGYIFVKDPSQVSIKDILWQFVSDQKSPVCLQADNGCPLAHDCLAKEVWQTLRLEVEKTLQKMSLEKIADVSL